MLLKHSKIILGKEDGHEDVVVRAKIETINSTDLLKAKIDSLEYVDLLGKIDVFTCDASDVDAQVSCDVDLTISLKFNSATQCINLYFDYKDDVDYAAAVGYAKDVWDNMMAAGESPVNHEIPMTDKRIYHLIAAMSTEIDLESVRDEIIFVINACQHVLDVGNDNVRIMRIS